MEDRDYDFLEESSNKINTSLDIEYLRKRASGLPLAEFTEEEALSFILRTVAPPVDGMASVQRFAVIREDHVPYPCTQRPAGTT